jgi:hypothetical protein
MLGGFFGGAAPIAPAVDAPPKLENSDKSINFIFTGDFPGLNDVQATFLSAGDDVPMAEPSLPVKDAGAYSFERDWQSKQVDDTAAIVLNQNQARRRRGAAGGGGMGNLRGGWWGGGGSADSDNDDVIDLLTPGP